MAAACRGQPCAKKDCAKPGLLHAAGKIMPGRERYARIHFGLGRVEFDTLDDRTQGPQSLEVTTRLDPQEKICRGRSRGLVHVDNDARAVRATVRHEHSFRHQAITLGVSRV